MFEVKPNTVEQADLQLTQLQRQIAEQEERKREATAQRAELQSQWAELCLAEDIDGADNAKAIADNERRQAAHERTITRADNALKQLAQRVDTIRQHRIGLKHKEQEALIRHLAEQNQTVVDDVKAAILLLAGAMEDYYTHRDNLKSQVQEYNRRGNAHGLPAGVAGLPTLEEIPVRYFDHWLSRPIKMNDVLKALGRPVDEPRVMRTLIGDVIPVPEPKPVQPVEPDVEPEPDTSFFDRMLAITRLRSQRRNQGLPLEGEEYEAAEAAAVKELVNNETEH